MKKYLIALAVALMVCLLGMTASAAERSTDSEDYKAAEREKEAISQALPLHLGWEIENT